MKTKKVKKTKGKKDQKQELPSTEKSAEIALYYGFNYIKTPSVTKEDLQKTKNLLEVETIRDEVGKKTIVIQPEEKVALMRVFEERNMLSWQQPVMLYYEGGIVPEGTKRKSSSSEKTFHLDIIGSSKSISEAMIIKTALEILKDEGYEDLMVRINSIGDKESMNRFCKELGNFYRKNIEQLSAHCKQAFKKDPFDVFACNNESCQKLKDSSPSPISYLSELSRIHFREVLEYLETLEIPYVIDNGLICHKKMWSQTCFEIRQGTTNELLAVGTRYNVITKKLGFKKEMGAIGLTVNYKKLRIEKKDTKPKFLEQPKVYFVQLGFEAKLKSLHVIEMLRKAKIPLAQSIGKDKLGGQMQNAESYKIPYMIIMGQKEAMENSVIVREMVHHSQETVALSQLSDYLRKIK